MEKQTIEGKWETFKGKAKTRWDALAHEVEKTLDELLAKLDRKVSPKKDEPQTPPS